ncbi:alpha/beta hydrolase [Streptomyces millisiae]|uniref:Alpha/beta hydrolase n=1 Tax=Streptomyces millisiae TaxID=3075542 RepID=A0ABU2LQV2_9ACTN|nr:alpha/beta hydrolase [Streptomyces sp. DSM 44918]MDT0319967.1 alpha/beta hydrolase [Streptomyces sp. DSM 44918]
MPRRRPKRVLATVALALTTATATGGWTFGPHTTIVSGPPPGAAAWLADDSLGVALPDPGDASPAEVAAFFAGLGPAQRRELAARHPLTVGNLDGAPVELRYEANARAWEDFFGTAPERGRQLLAFDPRGRGTFVEVFGDLPAAERTAVVVPGMSNDLDTNGTPVGWARDLHRELTRDAPGVPTATIAWVGYTTPDGVGPDVVTDRLARAGAPRLERFLAGLALTAPRTAPPTVLCHSYGSVVCGLAASELAAGDLVFLGSPGTRAGSVDALDTDARVWATRSPTDWISAIPNVSVLGLGHGTDPTEPAYGARVVTSADVESHGGYAAPGTDSLRNLSAITLGASELISCAPTSPECLDATRR